MGYSGSSKIKASATVGTHSQYTSAAFGGAPRLPEGEQANVLDYEKLQVLDAIMPRDEVTAFVEMYLTESEAAVSAIAEAAVRTEAKVIALSAHVLVSTAGNVGAAAVSDCARRLESACRNGREIAALIDELQTANRAASAALRAWLTERCADANPIPERA